MTNLPVSTNTGPLYSVRTCRRCAVPMTARQGQAPNQWEWECGMCGRKSR